MIYNDNKTIAAISTALGAGGIGIVRLSGDDAIKIADKVFMANSCCDLVDSKGYKAHYGKIVDDNGYIIDEGIALVFLKPHSYTGENVVEISCHGGMFITKKVLRAVINAGAVAALPGEFTKRAFLNGKLDLTRAESVMDLICAKNEQAAKIAICEHEGALFKKIESIKDDLVSVSAHISAFIDYPEEDIVELDKNVILNLLENVKNNLNYLLSNYDAGMIFKQGLDVVIVGKPNVGKSTIMNCLSGYEKSIVTDVPGTTRDIVEETITLGDIMINLSDTAGICDSDDPVEKIGIVKAKNKIKNTSIIIAVFDASRPLNKEDVDLIFSLENTNSIAVINKVDLEIKIDSSVIKHKFKHVVSISAKKNKRFEKLHEALQNIIGNSKFDPSSGVLINERQYSAAKNSYINIANAIDALNNGVTLDAVNILIDDAIANLMSLTGQNVTEEVVNQIFSKFCVGK